MTKNQLVVDLKNRLSEKVRALKNDISALVNDSSENSKPTSGDKHEVGLEMAMGELDRLSSQLDMYKRQLSELELMDFSDRQKVGSGALVKTDRGLYFVSVAFGVLRNEHTSVFCLSSKSPLARAMAEKKVGESVELNGLKHSILSIA